MLVVRVFIFVVTCVVLSRAMDDEMQELLDSLHKTCVDSIGVAEDAVAKAQKGDFDGDEKLKCYMKCILDELGLMGDDGVIDVEGMVGMLPDDLKDKLTPVVRKCPASGGADWCETAFLFNKCCYDTNPSIYFLP